MSGVLSYDDGAYITLKQHVYEYKPSGEKPPGLHHLLIHNLRVGEQEGSWLLIVATCGSSWFPLLMRCCAGAKHFVTMDDALPILLPLYINWNYLEAEGMSSSPNKCKLTQKSSE